MSTPQFPFGAVLLPVSTHSFPQEAIRATRTFDNISSTSRASQPCVPDQLPRTPRDLSGHRLIEPSSYTIAGNPALHYPTPPPSLHRGPGYAVSTDGRNMSSSASVARLIPRQTHSAVPVLLPDVSAPPRVVAPSLSTAVAQNGLYELVRRTSPSTPDVLASEPSPIAHSSSSYPYHIKHQTLMAVTPHASSRHSRYAHTDRHENNIMAPQPINASSRTVESMNVAHFGPSDALGLDIRPQRLFTECLDEWPSTPSQEAGPSSVSEPPQSRWSQRLRRLAPPPIQVPLPPSPFAQTPPPDRQTPYVETMQAGRQRHTEPHAQAPPRPSKEFGRAASQCYTWASSPADPVQSSASETSSARLQRVPFEERVRCAAGIYASHNLTANPLSPEFPPPVVHRYIPLPPLTTRSEYASYPIAGPSSRPEPCSPSQEGEDADADADGLSPLDISFQREPEVDWEACTARCLEAVEDMRYVLGSCALIPFDDMNLLITSLCAAIKTIRATMQYAPANVLDLEDAHGSGYIQKYFALLSSLTRNLDALYLQADYIRDRPPRVNKLTAALNKLWRFVEKLEDLGRRIQTFHDHLDVLFLHTQLQSLHTTAAAELEAERARRHAFEEYRAQARAHRREVRDEIRRANEAARFRRDRRGSTKVHKVDSVGEDLDGA